MLDRLAAIRDVTRSQALLQVLLKLLGLCVKVKRNQEELIDPKLHTVTELLNILQMCLSSDNEVAQSLLMDQILEVLDFVFRSCDYICIFPTSLTFFCSDFGNNPVESIVRVSEQFRDVLGRLWHQR